VSPLERETKLVISPEDYHALLRSGSVLERRDQLNIYLHDPARLGEEMGYVRVRFEPPADPMVTLKIPVGWRGDVREMIEVERPLSEFGPSLHPRPRRWVRLDEPAPEGFLEHLRALGVSRLRRLGWTRNLRCTLEVEPGIRIDLDRAVFPGRVQLHEVEIESPHEEIHKRGVAAVAALAPSARPTKIGKFTRFLVAAGFLPGGPLIDQEGR
jgi:hypothetical protein